MEKGNQSGVMGRQVARVGEKWKTTWCGGGGGVRLGM
jgi:hypothetical protein